MGPTYNYETLVTIGATNAMQNVYFAEYFKLQGTVREMWVNGSVSNALQYFKGGLILSTKSAHCEYRKPFFVFDTILCCMHIEDLSRVSARLVFDFYNKKTMSLHAFGWQQVVFKDGNRKTCRMPDEFQAAARAILWTTDNIVPRSVKV
jgi:acyl-CoA thioesterase FadM